MAIKKYINTTEAAELTGHPYNEILNLAKTGVLPCHRTHRGHYRLNVDAVEKYFGIQINQQNEESVEPVSKEKSLTSHETETRLIIKNHYQEVINRICAAKSSIKIMMGDFKRFKLKPTAKQGKNYNDGTPFIKHLMEKTKQGVSVQIICASPSKGFKEEYDALYEKIAPKNFSIYFCVRNHAKAAIIDDKIAYVGSANVTKAGLGQGVL